MRLLNIILPLLCASSALATTVKMEVVVPAGAASAVSSKPTANSILARAQSLSNVEPIVVRFMIDSSELVKGSPTGASDIPKFELLAFDYKGGAVKLNYWVQGSTIEYSHITVTIVVEIPIEADERLRQIEEFVDAAIAEANGNIKEYLKAQRVAAIASVDRLFFQQRVGAFRLHLVLRDPRVEHAEAEIGVQVAEKGKFTDKLRQGPHENQPK